MLITRRHIGSVDKVAGLHSYAVGTLQAWVHNGTFRYLPNNLLEQLALQSAMSGDGENRPLDKLNKNLKDPKLCGKEKWEFVHRGPNGNIVIHYVKDLKNNIKGAFKFK